MTKENKELLLRDLCGRLPYGVKASYYGAEEECETWDEIEGISSDGYVDIGQYGLPIESVKPYLFPLSSMTSEQKTIYGALCYAIMHSSVWATHAPIDELFDWLNVHHFDYRGLIEKGFAIDATGKNIY